jgi:hypothetical protein
MWLAYGVLVIENSKERKMGNVVTVPCRSYSARAFDGCPACVGAALGAVGQAGLYVLGRTVPGLSYQTEGPLRMAYRMTVELIDESGEPYACDELEADQTIQAVQPVDDFTIAAEPVDEETDLDSATMRLEDFQTVIDRLELAPAGARGVNGVIAGQLYGFEKSMGRFEIEVSPGA